MPVTDLCHETLFRQVVVQALNDALGYTNESYGPAHIKLVRAAQSWWLNPSSDFQDVCELAGLDPRIVRDTATKLIHAKITGDHSRIPDFWRRVFSNKRAPNMSIIDKAIRAIDKQAKDDNLRSPKRANAKSNVESEIDEQE